MNAKFLTKLLAHPWLRALGVRHKRCLKLPCRPVEEADLPQPFLWGGLAAPVVAKPRARRR